MALAVLHGDGTGDGEAEFRVAVETARRLCDNVETVVRGKRFEIELVLTALACGGHVLLEDVPGTAKTVLARALAASIEDAGARRIQCTPDLLPTDVTGLAVYDQRLRDFEFRPGPIFASVVLVDEINRALPKTQSALLEGDGGAPGDRRRRDAVAARALPPARNAEPDRARGHLSAAGGPVRPLLHPALARLPGRGGRAPRRPGSARPPSARRAAPCRDGRRRAGAAPGGQARVRRRARPALDRLARPRDPRARCRRALRLRGGTLALDRGVRAWALLHGRDYVEPEDVELLFEPVIAHRILYAPGFVAVGRKLGRAAAFRQVWEQCLQVAPRPEPQR